MLEEQWVTLDILPNYEVSNYGRIFNLKTGKERIPKPGKRGYMRVKLYRKGRKYNVYVHRLVAQCYFLNYNAHIGVEHKNGNKSDNSVLNLTLVAVQEDGSG